MKLVRSSQSVAMSSSLGANGFVALAKLMMSRKEGVRQRGSRLLGEEQRPRVEVHFVIAKDTLDQAVAADHRSSIHIQRQHRMFRDARREQCWR
jgi:hypothetical protein